MLLNGSEDLRVQKTIEAIQKTFEEMICEMNYEKITVKELCERARINKKTFYRYYDTLDDLLAELQGIITQDYMKRIESYRIPEELDKINREFFLYSVEKGMVYEKITCSGSYNYIRNKMMNHVISSTWGKSTWLQLLDTYKQNILLGFVQSASIEMYRRWVADGKKIPLEEIIEMSNQLLCSGVNGFVEKNMPL
ncbi:MAG: TetR/AcrR family transcriptional regulator [Lachnospiraceae bacterium]|nr:TetR/AcrR family transcriptional regulator [Lachnospiraceae bacterium]